MIRCLCSPGFPFDDDQNLDRRRLFELPALFAKVEEVFLRESERPRKQRRRQLLDAGVVFLHGIVEEAAAGGDLVFDVRQFGLQLLEVGVGLEVRISLRQRDQPSERGGELAFGGGYLRRSLRGDCGITGFHHVFQRSLLVGGVAFDGLDEVRGSDRDAA